MSVVKLHCGRIFKEIFPCGGKCQEITGKPSVSHFGPRIIGKSSIKTSNKCTYNLQLLWNHEIHIHAFINAYIKVPICRTCVIFSLLLYIAVVMSTEPLIIFQITFKGHMSIIVHLNNNHWGTNLIQISSKNDNTFYS